MLQNKVVLSDGWKTKEMPVEDTREAVIKNIETVTGIIAKKINEVLKKKNNIIIAVDGRCTAGKTTLASFLQEQMSCNIFHMDDFFLRPEQRTEERLTIPGENIDHERFLLEVLIPLQKQTDFSYRPYDCHEQKLTEPVVVQPRQISVVEGVYSCHPKLWNYYDLHIFLDVNEHTQKKRLLVRNGKEMTKRFEKLWIPMEESYFKSFDIKNRCELQFIILGDNSDE